MSLKDYILNYTTLLRCLQCDRLLVAALPEHGLSVCLCGWPMRVCGSAAFRRARLINNNTPPITIHELLS